MDEVVRFRAKAEECRRLAKPMRLNDDRDALLEMARQWDALADSWDERVGKKSVEPRGAGEDDLRS